VNLLKVTSILVQVMTQSDFATDRTLCSLLERSQYFGGTYCPHLQGQSEPSWKSKKGKVVPKCHEGLD
jgi:hypothetical protein